MPPAPKKRQPRLVVDQLSSDEDDESIPDDEAFNSDDERQYGSFFETSKKSGDSSSDSSQGSDDQGSLGSDDEEVSSEDEGGEQDGDGGQYMLDLLNKLDKGKESKDDSKKQSLAVHVKESEFASSVVPKAGLTLDSLMEGLQDTKDFRQVQKDLKGVAMGQATPAPASRVVSDRAQRKVQYEHAAKDVSAWLEAVQTNRQAETLDFRPKERVEMTKDILVEQFAPRTDFEKELQQALEDAGQQDEQAMLDAEERALHDDLGANELSIEEYRKRRGQLAKMRALLFYQEQKQHYIKKIKSKKYRRIRKKQRARQQEAKTEAQLEDDPDMARDLQEKEEVERMKERMTLAHKNTSKWAKRVLKRGRNVDKDTRKALSAQLQRGDDLLQRMKSTRNGDEEVDDSDEDLIASAKKVLADDIQTESETKVQSQGLFKLSFMQKGLQRQREQAKEEARRLLMELESNERDDEDSGDSGSENESSARKPKAKTASKEEMKNVLRDGELVASSLKTGTSSAVAVDGGIDIDLVVPGPTKNDKRGSGATSTTVAHIKQDSGKKTASSTKPPAQKTAAEPGQSTGENEKSNPWMLSNKDDSRGDSVAPSSASMNKFSQKAASKNSKKKGVVDVQAAVDLLDPLATFEPRNAKDDKAQDDAADGQHQKNLVTLTQEELVRRAFATLSEKDIDQEFAKEKAAVEEEEDNPTRKPSKKEKAMETVSGWGSWTGQGIPPPKPGKKRKLPKHLQPPEKKDAKRPRQDGKKPNLILSEKRIKKTANKYMVADVPYPYSCREEYERAMAGGVGREWNVTKSHKDMTRPEVMTRPGKIIQPLSKRVKKPRPPAKF